MAPRRALLALAVAFLSLLAAVQPAIAQTAPVVTDGGVQNNFPGGMTFSVSAQSDSTVEKVRLRYEILPDGTAAIGQPDFVAGNTVSTTFRLGGGGDLYLPPGTRIEYYWEATDADGDSARTDTASFVYEDVRFQWASAEDRGVTIHYYSGSEDDARQMLSVAAERIASMSQLLGAHIDFPVNVWVYQSTEDMRPALFRRSETYEQRITTAGVRVASDTVLVLGNVALDTLRHELTHVVTAVAGESAFGTLPAWLDEGTAVYGQSDPGDFRSALEEAVDRGNILSVRTITSHPGDPAKVELFYGEGWSLVKYLVDTSGPEKFAHLFAQIKSGKRIDGALQAVYGFDQDGLEDGWRASLGLPPRETPEPAPDEQPTDKANGSNNAPSASGDGGTSTLTIVGVALSVLAVAGLVGFAGVTIARRLR